MNPTRQRKSHHALDRRRGHLAYRPNLEALENRLVLTGDTALFGALTNPQFHWVDYAPSYDSPTDPYNPNPSAERITADLTALFQEGFRGLVTYTLDGTYASIPRIAKSVGFQYVIAGIYSPTSSTEIAAASSSEVLPYADAFVVGNEGLQDNRYTYDQLTAAIAQVQTATLKPTTTTEPGGQYYTGSPHSADLLALGDWLFPNTDYFLWNNQPSTPSEMWTNVSFFFQFALGQNGTNGPVVVKECFYPSGGGPLASEQNQYDWYQIAYDQALAGHFNFVWGEAFDQPWKTAPTAYEPHMGLHGLNNPDGTVHPKKVIRLIDPGAEVQFVKPTSTVVEGRTTSITLVRAGDVSQPSAVKVAVVGSGTASTSDFAPLPNDGIVHFRAGQRRATMRLRTVDDHADEAHETLILELKDALGARLGASIRNTVTIQDNDPPPRPGRARFTVGTAAVLEGHAITLTLARTGDLSDSATVEVRVGGSSTASSTDYLSLPDDGRVLFPAGASTGTITLTTVDDQQYDPSETIVLQILGPNGGASGARARMRVRITDNDPGPRRYVGRLVPHARSRW